MNEELHQLEERTRALPEYAKAMALLAEREQLEQQLQALDHRIEALAAAGKLARIDHLRQNLLLSHRAWPPVG
ncbi:hypothetical protein [Sterolibacterium denitrificans]|nr:hypothetical protein [Sterolibacterium denitrificans]